MPARTNAATHLLWKLDHARAFLVSKVAAFFAGALSVLKTVTTIAANGATTITAAQVIGGVLVSTNTGAATWTLPTGALLSAALFAGVPDGKGTGGLAQPIGTSIEFDIRNEGSATVTYAAGASGMTLRTSATLTVLTLCTKRFRAVLTAVDTWDVYTLGLGSAH